MKDCCYHCGELGSDDSGFLLTTPQLRDRFLTGGHTCFPIYIKCLGANKKPVTMGKKNEMYGREERLAKANAEKEAKKAANK